MKKTTFTILLSLLLIGCKQEKTENPLAPRVKVATIQQIESNRVLHYSGTVEAYQTIPLSFQIPGIVQQVCVHTGDPVQKGQLLATLENTDAKNMLEIAQAKYLQAKDAYRRLKEVYDKGSLPEIKWVEMETNLQQAESSVDLAKNNLRKCTLFAPESGFVGKRNIEPGMSCLSSLVGPIELVKIETVYVKISVPENEISKLKKGLQASIEVSALDDRMFTGCVSNIGVVADPLSRTYEVKIKIPNPNFALKPGMVCDVNLTLNRNQKGITVPFQAIDRDNNNQTYVYVVDTTQTAHKRRIQVGNYQNNHIEVLSGIQSGERVVIEGIQNLSDNCKIAL